jgi:hypothetical protein
MIPSDTTEREIKIDHDELRKKQMLRAFGHSRLRFEFGFSWQNYQKPVTVDDVARNLSRECPTAFSPGSDEAKELAQELIDEAVGNKDYFTDYGLFAGYDFMPLGSLFFPPLWLVTDSRRPHLVELAEDPNKPGVKRYQIRYELIDSDD